MASPTVRPARTCQLFQLRPQVAVAHDPQLRVRYTLEHARPGGDHLTMTLVVLAFVEPRDHQR
jgi:hypothetical protein